MIDFANALWGQVRKR